MFAKIGKMKIVARFANEKKKNFWQQNRSARRITVANRYLRTDCSRFKGDGERAGRQWACLRCINTLQKAK